MDEYQELKHICKFCSKSFPCGRSLGGHMRSHLITVPSSSSDQSPKKKLPPLGQLSYTLRENPKKTNRSLKSIEEDTLLQEKLCKECGKSFHSWKALFGHMKCHSVNGRIAANATADEEDSWNSSNKLITESSQSDNEPLRRKKRSKRYTKSLTNSSSLTNIENCDQIEQEEVALSLIILSRDKANWDRTDSVFETSDNDSEFLEAKEKQKKQSELKSPLVSRNLQVSVDEFNDQSEVNSPRKNNKSRKRKMIDRHADSEEVIVPKKSPFSEDFDKKSKFTCSICKKAFPSYQALGGHRASHKKFKGSCAPTNDNCSIETGENSPNQISDNNNKDEHECPICFRVFPSGQALGGHKRSHLIADQPKNSNLSVEITRKPKGQLRNFLDLNLPAPVEEECSDFKSWWLGASSHKHEPLLGLLSSS